jgi:acetyltransferase
MALVAVEHTSTGPRALGVSRYYLNPETGDAEFAVAVGDPWQQRGLGHHLMRRLMDVARQNNVRRLVGLVLRENTGMLRLVQGLGFRVGPSDDPTVVEAVLDLTFPSGPPGSA